MSAYELMKKSIPQVLSEIREIDVVFGAIDAALALPERMLERFVPSHFIDTANDDETDRIAASLGITPCARADDTRFRIRSVLLERRPYTMETVERALRTLLGDDGCLIERRFGANGSSDRINVRVALGMQSKMESVMRFLENTVPLNMQLTIELLYNKYNELSALTWGDLAAHTCGELRSDRTIGRIG